MKKVIEVVDFESDTGKLKEALESISMMLLNTPASPIYKVFIQALMQQDRQIRKLQTRLGRVRRLNRDLRAENAGLVQNCADSARRMKSETV